MATHNFIALVRRLTTLAGRDTMRAPCLCTGTLDAPHVRKAPLGPGDSSHLGWWANRLRRNHFPRVGRWLVVEDPLDKAQAIVVLSGRIPMRAKEAARLYKAAYAPQIWADACQ